MNQKLRLTTLAALLCACNGSKDRDSSPDTGSADAFACDSANSSTCTITLNTTDEDAPFPFDRYASSEYAHPRCEALEAIDPRLLLLSGGTANKFKSTLEGASGDAVTGLEAWYQEFEQICTDATIISTKRRTGPTGDIPVECVDQLQFTTNNAKTVVFNVTMEAQGAGTTDAIINQAQSFRVKHWDDTLGQSPDGCWMVFTPSQAKFNQQLWLATLYGMHHFKAPAYLNYTDACGTDVEVLVQRVKLEVGASDPADLQQFLDFMNDPTLNTTISQLTIYITDVDYVDSTGTPRSFSLGDPGPAGCSLAPWELGGAPLGIIDPSDTSQIFHLDELAGRIGDLTIIAPQ